MRWLLHGNLTPAVAENLRKREDHPVALAEVGLEADAPAAEVLKLARQKQLDLLTTDPALAEAAYELDLWLGRSMVQLAVDAGDVEQDDALDRLFTRYKRLTPDRLYIVTNARVKIRQLPSRR